MIKKYFSPNKNPDNNTPTKRRRILLPALLVTLLALTIAVAAAAAFTREGRQSIELDEDGEEVTDVYNPAEPAHESAAAPEPKRLKDIGGGQFVVIDEIVVTLSPEADNPNELIEEVAARHGAKVTTKMESARMYILQVDVENLAGLNEAIINIRMDQDTLSAGPRTINQAFPN